MRDIPHSLLPFDDVLQNISYKHDMRELIRYVLDHLEECSFGMVQRFAERELCELKFTPVAFFFFCNDSTLFLICSLIADAITTFLLDGRSYFFHSLITSTLPVGKDLSCLDNRQNKTWSLEDLEFAFSCSARAHRA